MQPGKGQRAQVVPGDRMKAIPVRLQGRPDEPEVQRLVVGTKNGDPEGDPYGDPDGDPEGDP